LVYKSIARVTDVPIAFSSAGRRALIHHGLFEDVVELPHGTSGVSAISDADIERVRRTYDLRQPVVLTLGFTNADKGADVLIAAANSIAESQDNEVQFLVAGSPRERRGVFRIMQRRDDMCQRRLERQAAEIIRVDIVFRGYVAEEDVAPLLHEAAVVALPYRRITQSGIANLALSSEAVIVASDLPGLRSDLGDAAKYVEPNNSEALAHEISNLLGEENTAVRSEMRRLSSERASANTYAKVAEGILIANEQRKSPRTRTPH
jgi:glycosyltransferase involved in cell wall biosynthesis